MHRLSLLTLTLLLLFSATPARAQSCEPDGDPFHPDPTLAQT